MKKLFLILMGVLVLSACAESVNHNAITDAENFIARNDYKSAQKISDDIMTEIDVADASVMSLCRLSMVYVKLSEQLNEVENMAVATKCYHAAVEKNADSVAVCFSELSVEDVQYAEMLRTLSDAIDAPRDIKDGEPIDSCCDVHGELCNHHECNN